MHADVVVVGGGAIGCAIALRLAQRGARVAVVERGVPGAAATAAAAGMLSPLGELRHAPALAALGRSSLDAWPAFSDELRESTGIDVEFRRAGTLHVSLAPSDDEMLDSVLAGGREQDVEAWTGETARAHEPSLSPRVRRAVFSPADACVDNRRMGHALWHAAQNAGARFLTGTAVELRLENDRASGIRLEDGSSLDASTIVLAAGAWSSAVRGVPPDRPVLPVRGEMLSIAPVAAGAALEDRRAPALLQRMIHGPRGYLVPRASGVVLAGATVEQVGFAPGPTANGIAAMIEMARDLVPVLGSLPIAETWAGYRPGTPDQRPMLGRDPAIDGLVWATGHFRNGILLTPVTGDRIAALIDGETVSGLDDFAPDRFERSRATSRA